MTRPGNARAFGLCAPGVAAAESAFVGGSGIVLAAAAEAVASWVQGALAQPPSAQRTSMLVSRARIQHPGVAVPSLAARTRGRVRMRGSTAGALAAACRSA